MLDINSSASRKFDKDTYNHSPEDFIPIACHYNENTLLTKNGELIQIIQINGINSEKISDKLFNLRGIVRDSIKHNINSNSFAFWVHTIRQKTNLDDSAPYQKLLPANIHRLWQAKNYWNDKFVNTLYISIVYYPTEIKISNLSAGINSLSSKIIKDFENKYLDNAFQKLNAVVDSILLDLQEFGAVKLGISFEDNGSFSEPMFLYHRITHLDESPCLVPLTDLSTALASSKYATSGDTIKVETERDEKFVAILSIKEYQEVSSSALDAFLQLPVELIATEIFYFISKEKAVSKFKDQEYILNISRDSELQEIKGMGEKSSQNSERNHFCNQKISIKIIGESLERLAGYTKKASQELSKVGIVHIREDINLEQAFWAQLPGNFSFIRKMNPVILENTTALASLHNFPTGNQYSIWGKALTILRTEKGTPYFMNFHNSSNKANSCIFGTNKTGKTVLTNFLISEATKYNPTIIYISNCNDSKIFIEAIEGKWFEKEKELINPFLLEDAEDSRNFIKEFLKIICNHYMIPLSESELAFLDKFNTTIFSLDKTNRNFSSILKTADFSSEGGELIKERLKDFMEEGLYNGVFDGEALPLSEGKVLGFNLYNFSEESFSRRFYPTERKFLEQFTINLGRNNSICVGILYALNYHLTSVGTGSKILAIDNLDAICKPENFFDIVNSICNRLNSHNGAIISNFNFSYLKSSTDRTLQKWLDLVNTKIVLPSDIKIEYLDGILGLNKSEIAKLAQLKLASRMFLINQDSQSLAAELSIASLIGVVRILSAKSDELNIYQKILEENPSHPDDWINTLYNALNVKY